MNDTENNAENNTETSELSSPDENIPQDFKKIFENINEYFPDQILTYYDFKILHPVFQTVLAEDYKKYQIDPNDKSIRGFEYKANLNLLPVDESAVGTEEEKEANRKIDPDKPFKLTLDYTDNMQLDFETADKYLNDFKNFFLAIFNTAAEHTKKDSVILKEDSDKNA